MKRTLKHSTTLFLEILLGISVLIIIALGAAAWKLSQGPIDASRLIPYIQSELKGLDADETVEIGALFLEWQGFENPMGLSARDVVVSNQKGPFVYAPHIDINISIRSLLLGQLKLETVWIRKIALSITKNNDGNIAITGHSADGTEHSVISHDNMATSSLMTLNDLIYDLPEVDALWIDKASIIYRDMPSNVTQKFDPVTFFIEMNEVENTRNLYGFLTFPFGEESQKNIVKMNFSTQADPVLLNISGVIPETPIDSFLQFMPQLPNGFDLNMVANTSLSGQLDNTWNIHQVNLKIDAPRGQIHFPLNDKDDMVDVHDVAIHVTQDPKTDTAVIENISMTINEEAKLKISGSLEKPQDIANMSGNINLSVQDLPQAYFPRYWPTELSDNGAYRWLVTKLSGGTFTSLNITSIFDLSQTNRSDDKPLPAEILTISGDMVFDGVDIDYNAPLPMAQKTSGTGTYKDVSLTINIDKANIGGMDITKGELYFDDLITAGTGLGKIKLPLQSDLQNVFDYIAHEPIAAFKNIDFKGKDAKGNVDATVSLDIPLLKDLPVEDIKVSVEGTVKNAVIPDAVKGLTLLGGPYDVNASANDIQVKGSGQLGGSDITFDWHEYFSKTSAKDSAYISKVTADVVANDKLRRAFTNDFANYFKGNTSGKVNYTKSKNDRDGTIDLNLDLTKTNVIEPSLGLNKPIGQKVKATTRVLLKNGDIQSVNDLKVSGKSLSLSDGQISFRTQNREPLITKAKLKNVTFNENKISVEMNEVDKTLKTNVTGDFLDIRPILSGKKKYSDTAVNDTPANDVNARPREYGVNVTEMRTADTHTLKSPQAYVRLNKIGKPERFELNAKLGKTGQSGDLFVRYTPDVADGLTLRVESNNAGETLRAFDLYPHIRGGQLQIAGVPLSGGRFGDVRGRARINGFKVSDAPVLLRLINALSFKGSNLSFKRLESDFKWIIGENGDRYTISNGRTSGASIALTFDGIIDTDQDEMEIKGTAAPLSALDKFIGKIPLIGQILTGGEALLAATYTISGNPSDPDVSVNPLSVLAPGIIRKMLFEGEPELEEKPKEPRKRSELN